MLNQMDFPYGTCTTAAETAAKVVTITHGHFVLKEGCTVFVKFTNANTAAVGSLTLNVNSTGAKNIKYANQGNLPDKGIIRANQTCMFTYDGTYWIFMNVYYNTNNYKSVVAANNTSDVDYRVVLNHSAVDTAENNVTLNKSNKLLFNPNSGTLTVNNITSLQSNDLVITSGSDGTSDGIGIVFNLDDDHLVQFNCPVLFTGDVNGLPSIDAILFGSNKALNSSSNINTGFTSYSTIIINGTTMKIAWGRTIIPTTGAKHTTTIAFTTSFSSIPAVIISPMARKSNGLDGVDGPYVDTISTQNFTVKTFGTYLLDERVHSINWFAIGL